MVAHMDRVESISRCKGIIASAVRFEVPLAHVTCIDRLLPVRRLIHTWNSSYKQQVHLYMKVSRYVLEFEPWNCSD